VSVKHFGLVGLGVMGPNLALNNAGHGLTMVEIAVDAEKPRSAHWALAAASSAVVNSLRELRAALAPARPDHPARPRWKAGRPDLRRGSNAARAGEVLYRVQQAYPRATERSGT
jgi:hypothetical protein